MEFLLQQALLGQKNIINDKTHGGGDGDISTQQFVHPKISFVVWPLGVTVDIKHNSYRVSFNCA